MVQEKWTSLCIIHEKNIGTFISIIFTKVFVNFDGYIKVQKTFRIIDSVLLGQSFFFFFYKTYSYDTFSGSRVAQW